MANRPFSSGARRVLFGMLLLGATLFLPPARSAFLAEEERHTAPGDGLAHGAYLVHHVAMCVDCHSPRNETGQVIEQHPLQGAAIRMSRPFPNMPWALAAPKIAGLPGGWTRESVAHLLQSGATPAGPHLLPPMPQFRMNERDAHAVADYLLSLAE